MSNIIKQGIMKRNLKLRTVIVAVFTFATIGLFAQTNGGVALPGAQADYANTTTQGTTYITEGMTIPAYAVPDPYFHPDNDPWGGTPDLTAGFTWVWSVVPAGLTFGTNNANDNYTTITAPDGTAGSNYTVTVIETAPAAWGGCSDAGIDLDVNVVDTATISFVAGILTAPEGDTVEICNSDIALLPAVEVDVAEGWQAYWIAWSLQVKTLAADGSDLVTYAADKSTPAALAADYPTTAPDKSVNAAATVDITTVADFGIIGTNTTVYRYTITSINDRSSRFGDFIGLDGDTTDESAFTYNNADGAFTTYTVMVHPTPTTGPIFHIGDAWAN